MNNTQTGSPVSQSPFLMLVVSPTAGPVEHANAERDYEKSIEGQRWSLMEHEVRLAAYQAAATVLVQYARTGVACHIACDGTHAENGEADLEVNGYWDIGLPEGQFSDHALIASPMVAALECDPEFDLIEAVETGDSGFRQVMKAFSGQIKGQEMPEDWLYDLPLLRETAELVNDNLDLIRGYGDFIAEAGDVLFHADLLAEFLENATV